MALRLRDFGIATAYATVGVGDVGPEMDIARVVPPDMTDEISDPEVIFLLGQADIAAMFRTKNFKRIFELRYPRAQSQASMVNWVFSTPLEGGRAEEPKIEEAPFRFIIHLRLRRAVFAYPGIEQKIYEKVNELLGRHRDHAQIHVGLGWSDLIVEGYFSDDSFEELAKFVIQAHGLRAVNGKAHKEGLPVLQRLLTVFGYRGDDPPAFTHNGHVTSLRCKPGSFDEIPPLFGPHEKVAILDGKADFMIVSNAPDPNAEDNRARDPKWLARQRELGRADNRQRLRKVETHLMYFPAEAFVGQQAFIDVGDEILHDKVCQCQDVSDKALRDIEETIRRLGRRVPSEQRYAIDNALFLLGAGLRNSSTCCDMRDAVIACLDGLSRTLDTIEKNGENPSPDQYLQMWQHLNDWHRLSELLLRQRTVGSYEEIFSSSDRSIVYSGGVQKFLYLADQVMADFARRVQPIDPPKFATIYDSVKTIYSAFRSGRLVRVPTSQIFSFPLIVPDLWHEVAGALFFLRFQKNFEQLDDLFEGKNPEEKRKEREEFLANVADEYADLMIYLYGFRGDFTKFAVSLFHGWRLAYRKAPSVVDERSRGHFLLRLYLVFEFHRFRELQKTRAAESALSLSNATVEVLLTEFAEIVVELHGRLKLTMDLRDEDWYLLRRNVVESYWFHEIQRKLYWPFVATEIERGDIDLSRFRGGSIIDLTDQDDISALFGELGYQLALMWPNTDFQLTAALTESAAIEYHRRQMTRRTTEEDHACA